MPIPREYDLDADLRELESKLSNLTPMAMPVSLVNDMSQLMDDCSDLSFQSLDGAELDDLEQQLSQLGGSAMSEGMITRMADAMDRWHEELPVEEKLVPFGNEGKGVQKASKSGAWAAAAAVALLGVLSALVLPSFDTNKVAQLDSTNSVSTASLVRTSAPRDAWVVPDSFTHKVTNTTDSGIVMSEGNKPCRSIRVEYVDTVKVLDDQGREIEIMRPGVEVVLLPVETN